MKQLSHYYDPNKPTTVMVDGSSVGLCAILVQDNRTIAYGSRAITPTESRYTQIEREALSVVFGCEHFHIYLAGWEFQIITDYKPLLYVWKKITPPLRMFRLSLRLLPYKFVMKYQKGENNIADYLSRDIHARTLNIVL